MERPETARLTLTPGELLCVRCRAGGSQCPNACAVDAALTAIRRTPDLHVTLETSFDETGARTERFMSQSPAERLRDLTVLRRLGLCPGDTRSARDLMTLLDRCVPDTADVCAYPDNPYGRWEECPDARGDYARRGMGFLPPRQCPEEMARAKEISCEELARAERIVIRAHHPLCVVCHLGRGPHPLAEDNLYEVLIRLQREPDLPVTLIEGAGECVVCPPCHGFDPVRRMCVAGCHLRDREKDLAVCVRLGISPGDTLPAGELLRRIRERIPHVEGICAYDIDTAPAWTSCAGARSGDYERGLALLIPDEA
ncbi:MAG: hypothetical protein ACOXZM_01775 [Eubacteriales bacterium]|jgi:hypothetical protein